MERVQVDMLTNTNPPSDFSHRKRPLSARDTKRDHLGTELYRSCRGERSLSSVSRAWGEAIRTNRVYQEKVRANSSETLIVHVHDRDDRVAFCLYSARERRCYELPQIPCLSRQVLDSSECIAVGGKIYVLGGGEKMEIDRVSEGGRVYPFKEYITSGEVYVLDLGGGRLKWEQSASMLDPRFRFGCGATDGKIYVFGGGSSGWSDASTDEGRCFYTDLLRSEVYNTLESTWSPIMPMTQTIFKYNVPVAAPIGNELFLYYHNGETFGAYNPGKDEWRFVERFWEGKVVFTAEGKFYSISQSGIDVYDVEQKSWISRHTNSFAAHRPSDC